MTKRERMKKRMIQARTERHDFYDVLRVLDRYLEEQIKGSDIE